METAKDLDLNDDFGEEDFRSQFGLDQIDDPGEKAKRRDALKDNEEIVKWVNKAYAKGDITWYDKINDMADLTKDEFVKEKTGLHKQYGRGLLRRPDGPEGRDERSEKYFDKF